MSDENFDKMLQDYEDQMEQDRLEEEYGSGYRY